MCSVVAGRGGGSQYGPQYGTGDVVGCGIDFTTRSIFFTKNGCRLPDCPLNESGEW